MDSEIWSLGTQIVVLVVSGIESLGIENVVFCKDWTI